MAASGAGLPLPGWPQPRAPRSERCPSHLFLGCQWPVGTPLLDAGTFPGVPATCTAQVSGEGAVKEETVPGEGQRARGPRASHTPRATAAHAWPPWPTLRAPWGWQGPPVTFDRHVLRGPPSVPDTQPRLEGQPWVADPEAPTTQGTPWPPRSPATQASVLTSRDRQEGCSPEQHQGRNR